MWNKLISILILIFTIVWIYWLYYYYFVLNKWGITLNLNIWNYQVSLYNDKLKTNFSTNCINKKCDLIDLAPFDYELTISKEWYKNFKQNITVFKKNNILLDIILEKQLYIKKVENNWNNDLTWKDITKFRELAFLNKSYKYFNLSNLGYFYFIDNNDDTLSLFRKNIHWEDTNLYNFKKIDKNLIDLQNLYNTENFIFISMWDYKYIYDIKSWKVENIFFPQKVNYAKKDLGIVSFINEKWTFIYDIKSKNLEYFYLFKDFVYFDDKYYLGIIFNNEKDKKKNYNLESYEWNLIIRYNFLTKEIKILEKLDTPINKIIKQQNKVYFYETNWTKYQVNNIERN